MMSSPRGRGTFPRPDVRPCRFRASAWGCRLEGRHRQAQRGGTESTVCVDPYQPPVGCGTCRRRFPSRRLVHRAPASDQTAVVRHRRGGSRAREAGHRRAGTSTSMRPSWLMSALEGVCTDAGTSAAGSSPTVLIASVRPGAAFHAEGQAERAVATQCEQLVGSIPREAADGCRDIVAEVILGSRSRTHFPRGDAAPRMVRPEGRPPPGRRGRLHRRRRPAGSMGARPSRPTSSAVLRRKFSSAPFAATGSRPAM